MKTKLFAISLLVMMNSGFLYAKTCADQRDDLRKELDKCKNASCKNQVKRQIDNFKCEDKKPTQPNTPPKPAPGKSCADKRDDLRKDLNKCKTDRCKKRVKDQIKHLECEKPTDGSGTTPPVGNDSNCKEKKDKLITRLKKCKTPQCKNSVRKKIEKVSCSESEKEGDSSGDGVISGNHSKECQHLIKLWTIKEPLDKEGRPDVTNLIDANFAYREVQGGLSEVVKGAGNHNYDPKSNGPLENQGKNHPAKAAFRKGDADIGAFEIGKPFPQVGAAIPKWGMSQTNSPGAAKKAGLSFQPHRAHWVDQVRSEQDDL